MFLRGLGRSWNFFLPLLVALHFFRGWSFRRFFLGWLLRLSAVQTHRHDHAHEFLIFAAHYAGAEFVAEFQCEVVFGQQTRRVDDVFGIERNRCFPGEGQIDFLFRVAHFRRVGGDEQVVFREGEAHRI